jgi:hypothetical protein
MGTDIQLFWARWRLYTDLVQIIKPPIGLVQRNATPVASAPPVYRPATALPASPPVFRPNRVAPPALQPAMASNAVQMARGNRKTAPNQDREPPLPGRRKRLHAQQEQDLLANALAVKERLKQKQEETFFAKRLNERNVEIGVTRNLHVPTQQLVNPAPLTQTQTVKLGFGDDSNTAFDYYFLAQRLPLAGIAGAIWLSQQPALLKRFVWNNIAHLNIANFQILVPDVFTLCTSAPKVQNPQQALQILALNLNGADVNEWVALMTNYAHITGHQVLINLCNAVELTGLAVFPDCTVLRRCLGCGKDPKKNKWLRDLGLKWAQITSFATRMASETEQIQTCTTLGLAAMPIGADYGLVDLIQIWLEVDNCSVGNLIYLVQNYANLQHKTTIKTNMVARLVRAGLLIANSGGGYMTNFGRGQTFSFCFPNGRKRLKPEWHIHFQAAGGKKAAICVGGGWKHKSEKYTLGQKATDSTGDLPDALKELGLWAPPKI